MIQILSLTTPIFAVMLVGYLCGRRGLFPAGAGMLLTNYVFLLCMPVYLFVAIARMDPAAAIRGTYLMSYALSFGLTALIGAAGAAFLFRRRSRELVLATMCSAHSNAGYLGIPLVILAFGEVTPAVAVICFQVVVVTPIVLFLLELGARGEAVSPTAVRRIPAIALTNPVVAGSLAGFAVALTGVPLPPLVVETGEFLGGAAMPTAIFALGLSLAERPAPGVVDGTWGELVWLTSVKLVVAPLCAWGTGAWLGALSPRDLGALCVMAGMPAAMNAFIFARRYNTFVGESSRAVLWSTVGCVVTVNLILWAVRP